MVVLGEREFNHIEKKILRFLYQTKAPLTLYEIAKETGISFPTVKKYIKQLTEEGFIIENDIKKEG